MASTTKQQTVPVTTLIFDIDDTLYPADCGFTAFRNGALAEMFMVEHLGFKNRAEAKLVRDEYFERYHSTVKGLAKAGEDGKLPLGNDSFGKGEKLVQWWVERCEFEDKLPKREDVKEILLELKNEKKLHLVAFTNGPREYAKCVLDALGLRECFPDDLLFAVEDVLPMCKPEKGAFAKVLAAVGNPEPSSCVMFEDSIKNVRAVRDLGMRTVFVEGSDSGKVAAMTAVERAALIDVTLNQGSYDFKEHLGALWEGRFPVAGTDAQSE